MKGILLASLILLPNVVLAEELLPALCRQVLEPSKETSISQIVSNHVIEKVKEIPTLIVQDAKGALDKIANNLADTLESKKSDGAVAAASSAVLGTSTARVSHQSLFDKAYNYGLDALAFLLRHWLWSISALGLIIIGWSLRV